MLKLLQEVKNYVFGLCQQRRKVFGVLKTNNTKYKWSTVVGKLEKKVRMMFFEIKMQEDATTI